MGLTAVTATWCLDIINKYITCFAPSNVLVVERVTTITGYRIRGVLRVYLRM